MAKAIALKVLSQNYTIGLGQGYYRKILKNLKPIQTQPDLKKMTFKIFIYPKIVARSQPKIKFDPNFLLSDFITRFGNMFKTATRIIAKTNVAFILAIQLAGSSLSTKFSLLYKCQMQSVICVKYQSIRVQFLEKIKKRIDSHNFTPSTSSIFYCYHKFSLFLQFYALSAFEMSSIQ